MKKLKEWCGSLNLQNRLLFSYIGLILVPLFLFGAAYYQAASDSILDITRRNVMDVTVKNLQLVEERLGEIEERAEWVLKEDSVKEALEKVDGATETEIIAMDRKVGTALNKYFYGEHVVSAFIITPRYVLGNNSWMRMSVEHFYQSDVYRKVVGQDAKGFWLPTYYVKKEYQLDWEVERSTVFSYLYRLEMPASDAAGEGECFETILMVSLNTNLLREIFEGNNAGGAVYCISDQEGNIILYTDEDREGMMEKLPWLGEIAVSKKGTMLTEYQGQKAVICYAVSPKVGWVAASSYPTDYLLEGMAKMQYVTYGLAGLLLALALFLAMFLAQRITHPLERLEAAMKKAEEGDFSDRIPVTGNDEIQYLVSRYNEMGSKIEKLIEENYKSELRNKESEIMALNMQMNPHFLYNTLNIINLMALEEEELEISRMLISVSDMMQYMFRNKQEMVRLMDELEWLKNYTYIMEQRFEGKFQVSYDLEDEALEYLVPKLLLQPLAENAIIHGFQKMDAGGILEVSVWLDEGRIGLKIADNGQGISEERLQAALNGSAGRTGMRNVQKRLALIYGKEAEYRIETGSGKGCVIYIMLPGRR